MPKKQKLPAIGFDNEKYLKEQTAAILERIKKSEGTLYLEFGGKLLFDYHAARVLPGFDPNVKIKLLKRLKDQTEVLLCIYAGDIEKGKVRADFGITYDVDLFRMIDDLIEWGIPLLGVVITRYENQPAAKIFKNKLKRRDIKVFIHKFTKGYPTNVDVIVSNEGYGANDYVKTTKPLVVITAPGPGSGKLATCLSQLYHDYKNRKKSEYAKFETFPIWNLPLKHPINIAYEAATAEMKDVNMIDPFHLKVYNIKAVNYNRDIEAFPVLKRILERITGKESIYQSPTDMGVNCAKSGITNDEVIREAAKQEVIRRFFRYSCEYALGLVDKDTVERSELLMEELKVNVKDRPVVMPARKAAIEAKKKDKGNEGIFSGSAIQLKNGKILTGKNSSIMHASSSLILNAVKELANIPDNIHLLSPNIIRAISNMKKQVLNSKTASLSVEETLIALAMSAATNPTAQMATEKLKELRNCEVHLTHMPSPGDEAGLRKLGLKITTEPHFASKNMFVN